MTPCDLVIVYHIHAVWTLTTEMCSMMLAMSLVSQNDDSPLVYRKYYSHKCVQSNKKRYGSTVDNELDVLLQHAFVHVHRLNMWYMYFFNWYVCTSHNMCSSFTQPCTLHVTVEFHLHTCEVINKYELCENLWYHKLYRENCVLINELYFCILQWHRSIFVPMNSFSLSCRSAIVSFISVLHWYLNYTLVIVYAGHWHCMMLLNTTQQDFWVKSII